MKLDFDELIEQKTIYLEYKGLVNDDLDILCKVIEESKVLEKLDLGHNNLTLADKKLANAIANNTTLKVLWLYNNNISPEGVKLLANALKKNSTLQILSLHSNTIGDKGAQFIAEMLAVNKSLQKIGLSYNNIGDKGAESIAKSLAVNTGIQRISLRYNEISDKGAEKLAEALESNHFIEYLALDGNNNISANVIDRIDKNEKIAMLKSIAKKDEKLESKDTEIAKKDREIAKKDCNLEAFIRGQLQQFETIIDPVDLTNEDDNEPASKRARTEDTPKSALAIQHEQNQQYSQRLVQVKQEKNAAETALEGVREDLEDNQEDMGRQALFTDFLQSKIDELAVLAEAGGADRARVAEIKSRSYSSMRS